MRISLCCLALAFLPGLASAQLVQTIPFSFVPNGSVDLSFDKFDTLGGTRELESVVISVSYEKTGGNTAVDNDSDLGGAITISHIVTGQLSAVDNEVRMLDSSLQPIAGSGDLRAVSTVSTSVGPTTGDDTSSFNETNLGDYASFSPSPTSVSAFGSVNPLFHSDYTVTGSDSAFVLRFAADQSATSDGVSGLQQVFTVSDVAGFVSVTYNYAAVPEVSSSALLAGLAVMGLTVRRRRGRRF